MEVKNIIYLVILINLFFTSCKKYPENDHPYLQSVKNRLDKHEWFFSKLLVDGNDSTLTHLNNFTNSYSVNPSDIHFRVKNFSYNSSGSEMVLYLPILYNVPYSFQFSLRPKKEKVYIGRVAALNGSLKNFFIENDTEWEVKKLTKTEFVLEKSISNVLYRFEFKK